MSTTKVDMVLAALDRIHLTIEQEISRLGMSPQPFLQFSPAGDGSTIKITPHMALVQAAYNRSLINRLLERVPEPPEEVTSKARHIGATSDASRARIAAELNGQEQPKPPAKKPLGRPRKPASKGAEQAA